MKDATAQTRTDRYPGDTYEDILERDSRPVPDHLREKEVRSLGTEPIKVSRYFDPEFFQQEVDHVWSRVWQWACLEDDIPNVGDHQVYDNVGRSLIITRTGPDKIRAFYNSCLHRGRQLVTEPGCKTEFRCPYHGITWNTDGSLKENPIAWDFPQLQGRDMSLPEARVERWAGFVFVNFDQNAKPLMHHMGPIAEHFERYDWRSRYKAVHVQKVVRANWKVTAEAFMEANHVITTHPQLQPYLADVNSQYDFLNDYVSRNLVAMGVPSPLVADRYTDDDVVRAYAAQGGSRRAVDNASGPAVPDGASTRTVCADMVRRGLALEDGWDYSECSDAEMVDSLVYNLWPNLSFWAGYAPSLVYRWRPNGLDPSTSIMDLVLMKRAPKSGARPSPAPIRHLGPDDRWADAPELGPRFGGVFDQDEGNLPYMERGMRSSRSGVVYFGRYTEMRIRQMHKLIDEYIAAGTA